MDLLPSCIKTDVPYVLKKTEIRIMIWKFKIIIYERQILSPTSGFNEDLNVGSRLLRLCSTSDHKFTRASTREKTKAAAKHCKGSETIPSGNAFAYPASVYGILNSNWSAKIFARWNFVSANIFVRTYSTYW